MNPPPPRTHRTRSGQLFGAVYGDHATISPCGVYRYDLQRHATARLQVTQVPMPMPFLGDYSPDRPLVICGLNPSTADATIDDNTIRKEMGFALRWGCGVLIKVNAYAFRATAPKVMKAAGKRGVDIIGPDNDAAIADALGYAARCANHGIVGKVLVAWGANIDDVMAGRQRAIAPAFIAAGALCLGKNLDGTPVHPLYIPYDRKPVLWSCP